MYTFNQDIFRGSVVLVVSLSIILLAATHCGVLLVDLKFGCCCCCCCVQCVYKQAVAQSTRQKEEEMWKIWLFVRLLIDFDNRCSDVMNSCVCMCVLFHFVGRDWFPLPLTICLLFDLMRETCLNCDCLLCVNSGITFLYTICVSPLSFQYESKTLFTQKPGTLMKRLPSIGHIKTN